jgi:hypothetical protein
MRMPRHVIANYLALAKPDVIINECVLDIRLSAVDA